MADVYMPEANQIKKQGDNYVMYCKNGNILTINREGWVVKEPDYKMVESKKHKTIVISESQAENLKKHILLEDKRTKQAMNRARQVIRERFNNEPWLDNVFNHQDNPKGLTYLEYMLEQFIDEFYQFIHSMGNGYGTGILHVSNLTVTPADTHTGNPV